MNTREFLSDQPSGLDSFASKAHTKIANAISETIEKEEIKLIGIEGEWGSGKSNIVQLIKKILEKNKKNKYLFYVYDAWGHQEDLQRRSFLENLTEIMQENFKDPNWQTKLNSLLSRKTITEEKEIPKLSIEILISFLILYFNNKTQNQDFCEILSKIPNNFLFLKNIVSLLINNTIFILGFLFLFLFLHFCRKNTFSEIFYLYKGKVLNKKLETITSTKEPSVREFKNWIKDVSQTLTNKNIKMIIVYDNIDRLPSNKVKEIWSSIHTFFSEEEYENITVLIPFSRKHIISSFSFKNNILIEDIVEKTFPVVYHITPPILIDWKQYFYNNLKIIFPNIKEDESIIISNLYDQEKAIITPRGIKNFINELKVTNSIYKNIELKYISLFLLIREQIKENIPHFFYNDNFEKYKRTIGRSSDKKIAALYFGVDEEKAISILLKRNIIKALEEGNTSEINKMSKVTDFKEQLNSIITELQFEKKLDDIYQTALIALKEQGIENFILDNLFNTFQKQESYFSFQEYHKILLESKKEKETIEKLLELEFYNKNIENININALCNQLKEFEKYIKNKGYDFTVNTKNYEPKIFLQMLQEFREKYKYYGINFDIIAMENYLIKNIRELTPQDIQNVFVLINDVNFNHLKEELISRIKDDKDDQVRENEFKIFTELLKKSKENLTNLENEFNMEILNRKLQNIYSNTNTYNPIETAYILSLILALISINPNGVNKFSNFISTLNSRSEEELNNIGEIVKNYLEIDKLFIFFTQHPNSTFIKHITTRLIETNNIKYLNLENILEHYHEIKKIIPDNEKNNFFKLINSFYNQDFKLDYKTILNKISQADIITDSKTLNLPLIEYLQELFIEYFNDDKNEETKNFLTQECKSQNYKLIDIFDVVIKNTKLTLSTSILKDFNNILKEIIDTNFPLTKKNINILNKIIEKVKADDLENTVNLYVKEQLLKTTAINFEKFMFFKKLFIKTKFFYFAQESKENQTKKDEYNKLIEVIIKPHIKHKETGEFILECTELKNGIKILKDSNKLFISNLESIYQDNIEIKKFIKEIKGE